MRILKHLARFLLLVAVATLGFTCIISESVRIPINKPTPAERPAAESDGYTLPIAGQDEAPADGIILDAPELADVGELVRFDASQSPVNLTWQILPHTEDFEVIEGGKRAFFSSRVPGQYLIIVAGAKGDVPYLQHFTIIVDGGDFQPGPLTLSRKVAAMVRKVKDYEGKHADAARLAANFRKAVSSPDVDIDTILNDTAVGNSAALGDNQAAWESFLVDLGGELDSFIDAGELNDLKQYKAVWLEIADGIESTIPKDATDLIEKETDTEETETNEVE
jgi:hypothetical protein